MNLIEFFKEVVDTLNKGNIEYALAGGLVASIYRENERTTNDLDFLIFAGVESQNVASSIIRQFNLEPQIIRKADLVGGPLFAVKRKNTTPYIIAGRPKKDENRTGLDFILPEMPWFWDAIKRAEFNKIDFGFGMVPCLTKEDFIVSKLYSLKNDQTRFNDMDDLKSVFKAGHEIDLPYICGQIQKLKLLIPEGLRPFTPRPMILTSKLVLKELRRKSGGSEGV